MTTKPNVITPQELAAIRERAERASFGGMGGKRPLYDAVEEDIPLLIAEITRLRTAIAEMAHYEAPYGLETEGYGVLRIMARQALDNGGDTE